MKLMMVIFFIVLASNLARAGDPRLSSGATGVDFDEASGKSPACPQCEALRHNLNASLDATKTVSADPQAQPNDIRKVDTDGSVPTVR